MADVAPFFLQRPQEHLLEHAIRRTSEAPERIETVLKEDRRPHLIIEGPRHGIPEGVSLAVRSDKWWSDPDQGLGDDMQFRDLSGVLTLSGQPIGAVIFHEVRFEPFLGPSVIYQCLDDLSAAWAEVGNVFFRHWSQEDLIETAVDRFHLVEFSTLWVHPDAPPGCWQAPVRRLIKQRYQNRAHLMLLKPFPLEYEGEGKFLGDAKRAFDRRRTAMMRLYNKSLSATPLDDPDRADLWMYMPLCPDLPLPSPQPDLDF